MTSNIDYYFYKKVASELGGAGITKCLSCGTCSSTCQVFPVNPDYNPRKIIQKAILGLKEEVLNTETIWICARCNSCTEICPKGIRPGDIINAIRHVAIKEKTPSGKGIRHSIFFKKSS